jgi:hypothetical protein
VASAGFGEVRALGDFGPGVEVAPEHLDLRAAAGQGRLARQKAERRIGRLYGLDDGGGVRTGSPGCGRAKGRRRR